MAITKKQKTTLVADYAKDLKAAKNVVLVKQSGIPVNDSNTLRMNLADVNGKLNVVRKNLFLRSLAEADMEVVEHEKLEGAVVALYAMEDEFAPMKEIGKFLKEAKKADKKYSLDYVGGWFEGAWKDAEYVTTLANLPSKEELIGKLLFLLKHPVQKLVGTLDAIAKKDGNSVAEAAKEEPKAEEAKTEEVKEDVAAETAQSETPTEETQNS